jgi:hypothetical protein
MLTRTLTQHAIAFAVSEKLRLVSTIQRFARAFLSRAKRVDLQDTQDREELLIARRARREVLEDTAASKIQSLARMNHAKLLAAEERRSLENHTQHVTRCIIRLQCWFRQANARRELRRRRLHKRKRQERLQRDAEVAHDLFLMRVDELDRIQDVDRRHIETSEEQDWRRCIDLVSPVRKGAIIVASAQEALRYSEVDSDDEDGIYDE